MAREVSLAVISVTGLGTAAIQYIDKEDALTGKADCSEAIASIVVYHVEREQEALDECRKECR